MPTRLASRPVRGDGPTPFSTDWSVADSAERRGRPLFALPSWFPSERVLGSALVLGLVLGVALVAGATRPPGGGSPSGQDGAEVALAAVATAPLGYVPDATATATAIAAPTRPPTPVPTYVPAPLVGSPIAAYSSRQPDLSLFPTYRVLAYYGHPLDENMGILGEHAKEDLLDLLLTEASNYEAIDPSRPVVPAFEIIATVAQRDPGEDGTFILDTDPEVIQEWIDFAAAHDALVFLDVQIGRGTVADEIEKVRPFLEQSNVHLALDPEFAIDEGETPGVYIGEITADQVSYAQATLAAIAAEQGIPPKVLIVHQFREDMIEEKGQIQPVPGVQWVLDADGFGAPELKTEVYNILVRDEEPRPQFAGVKLFYSQDEPLMTPAEVLALSPPPDLIIYQ